MLHPVIDVAKLKSIMGREDCMQINKLAERAEISRGTAASVLKGIPPSTRVMCQIAKALHMTDVETMAVFLPWDWAIRKK